MRTKSRILAFLVMLSIMFTLTPQLAFAADATVAAMPSTTACAAGDTVDVSFNLLGNPGFWGAAFTVDYDTAALSLTEIKAGELFVDGNTQINTANGAIVFYGSSLTENITGDGVMFTATFNVNTGVKPGGYTVSAHIKDNAPKNFLSADGVSIPASFEPCTITVDTKNVVSDADGSEVVVTVDIPSKTEFVTDTATGKMKAVVKVKSEDIVKAVNEAVERLQSYSGDAMAELKIIADMDENISSADFNLIVKDIRTIAVNKNIMLTLESSLMKTSFDSAALEAIAEDRQDPEPVKITHSIADVPASVLYSAQNDAIPVNHAAQLGVTVNGEIIDDFKSGKATIIVPYTPPSGYPEEDYDLLTAYYNAGSNEYTEIPGTKYDADMGELKYITHQTGKFFFCEWINPFTDLKKSNWYYKNVHYVYSYGIMQGVDAETFSGETALTRVQVVTMLWNQEGKPAAKVGKPFSDVEQDEWYSDAIAWVSSNDIVSGYSNDVSSDAVNFGPNDSITREQHIAILFRHANWKSYVTKDFHSLWGYMDYKNVSLYAYEPFMWAVAHGLVTSADSADLVLMPKAISTRGQAAALTQRFIETKSIKTGLTPAPIISDSSAAPVPTLDDMSVEEQEIVNVSPSGTDVSVSGMVIITFKEAMSSSAGTVKLNAITLSGGSWSKDYKTYSIPYVGLTGSTTYKIYISGFKTASGVSLADDSSRTFTTADAAAKTITVDNQSGTLTEGTAGRVTYSVTTGRISSGSYTATLSGNPSGVTASSITISGGKGTLTVISTESAPAGTYSMKVTIDGAVSSSFTLTINAKASSSDNTQQSQSSSSGTQQPQSTDNGTQQSQSSSDATLQSLSISGATLSPQFSPNTTQYTAEVEDSVTSVTVNATAANSMASVSGTGTTNLTEGTNTITITVTAENGSSKTYTITIARKAAAESKITVSFTLLGDKLHDSDSDGQVHGLAMGGLITWMSKSVTVNEGSNVADVLDAAGVSYPISARFGRSYIESVTFGGVTIGEFTNGPNSGWMYTLNGTHPNLGVEQQIVKNGDVIIFHYTDDYTQEEGSWN